MFQDIETDIAEKTMGIYTVPAEGHGPDGPGDGFFADVGVVLKGVEVLHNLQSVSHACVVLNGLIYTLNLSNPKSLKYIWGISENPDGHGLNQAFTKTTGAETQIAPVIWLVIKHLHRTYLFLFLSLFSNSDRILCLNDLEKNLFVKCASVKYFVFLLGSKHKFSPL